MGLRIQKKKKIGAKHATCLQRPPQNCYSTSRAPCNYGMSKIHQLRKVSNYFAEKSRQNYFLIFLIFYVFLNGFSRLLLMFQIYNLVTHFTLEITQISHILTSTFKFCLFIYWNGKQAQKVFKPFFFV